MFNFPGVETPPVSVQRPSDQVQQERSLALDYVVAVLLLVAGSMMLAGVHEDPSPLAFSVLYLIGGAVFVLLTGSVRVELRSFVLTFSVCVFVAGLLQFYSMAYFDRITSTIDAYKFLYFLKRPSVPDIEKLSELVNSPGAIYVWRFQYTIADFLGLKSGIWIAVQFNAFVVALAAIFVVKAARLFLEGDERKAELAGLLFAICGYSFYFGSLLIRDAFALLLNCLVLWAIAISFMRPGIIHFLISAAVISLSAILMGYIRQEGIYIILMICLLASAVRYVIANQSAAAFVIGTLMLVAVVVVFGIIGGKYDEAMQAFDEGSKQYQTFTLSEASNESLGVRFILQQPTPIRLIAGSINLVLRPIPLWGYFHSESWDYHLVQGIFGFILAAMVPFVINGCVAAAGSLKHAQTNRGAPVFLALYFISTISMVALTTLEPRHFGQFIAGLLLVALLPDGRKPSVKRRIRLIGSGWALFVVAVHLLALAMKY